MKILIVTQYYLPEKGGPIKRIAGIAENLKELGNEVHILTGFPQYPTGKKDKDYRFKVYKKEYINDVKVFRTYEYSSSNKNFINRTLNYFSLAFSASFFSLKRENYDLIMVSSPPLFIGMAGYIISRMKRIPMIFDVRDIWPDIAVEMGEMEESDLSYSIMNKIANFMYKKSSLITVVTEKKKNKLIQEKNVPEGKVELISNGFDSDFLDNKVDYSIVEKNELNIGHVFVYTGLVGLAQGLELLVEAADLLQDYDKNIRILIIGDGPAREDLEEKTRRRGLKNIEFLGLVEPDKIYTFLQYARGSLIPLKNENLQDSVPSKLYEALGTGCPVILSASGEAERIVKESGGGIVVPPNSAEEIKEAIIQLSNKTEKARQYGENGKNFVLENYTRKEITNKLLKRICQKLI